MVMKKLFLIFVAFLCMQTAFAQRFYRAEFTDDNKEGVFIVDVNFITKRITLYKKVGSEFLFYSVFDKMIINQDSVICAKYTVYENECPPIEERNRQLYFIVSDNKVECNNIKQLDDHFNLTPVSEELYEYFKKNLISEINGTRISEGGTSNSNVIAGSIDDNADNSGGGKPLVNDINSTSGARVTNSTTQAANATNSTGDGMSVAELIKKAEEGDKNAQKALGKMYDEGKGVAENKQEALKWYKLAAEKGDAESQFYVGRSYYTEGTDRESDKTAFKWFEKAAKQDNPDVQLYMAECYFYGYGVTPNYELAVDFYKKSATLGYAEAMFSLGWCYENGYGVNTSLAEAKKWYRKAKEKGSANAIQRLKDIGE